MNRYTRALVALLALGISLSASLLAAPAAQADSFGTNWSAKSGISVIWGPYSQITAPKSVSNQMSKALNAGDSAQAVALVLCAAAPGGWVVKGVCIYAVTKQWLDAKDAIKGAKANSNKCVAIRVYSNPLSQVAARTVTHVGCNFGIQCCDPGGSGGGGGGGGGGSWRETFRAVTIDRTADF